MVLIVFSILLINSSTGLHGGPLYISREKIAQKVSMVLNMKNFENWDYLLSLFNIIDISLYYIQSLSKLIK